MSSLPRKRLAAFVPSAAFLLFVAFATDPAIVPYAP